MNNNDVKNYLPHRYPFLLIDKVLDFKTHTYLTAQKNVSNNEPFFHTMAFSPPEKKMNHSNLVMNHA